MSLRHGAVVTKAVPGWAQGWQGVLEKAYDRLIHLLQKASNILHPQRL